MRAIALTFVLFSSLLMIQPTASAASLESNIQAAISEELNINTASADQMAKALSGIGKSKAEAIVSYREVNGPFESVQDLSKVRGIGKKTVEANVGLITIGDNIQ